MITCLRAFLVVLICLPACVYGQDCFRIAVEEQGTFPIYDYHHTEKGYLKRFLDEFGKFNNVQFEYVPLPIERFFKGFEENEIDFRFPDNKAWSTEQSHYVHYSQPLLWVQANTVVLAKNQLLPASEIRIVGIITGYTPSLYWREKIESGRVDLMEISSPKLLVQSLQRGIIDSLDINLAVVRHHVKLLSLPENDFVQLKAVPAPEYALSISTVKHKAMLERLALFQNENKATIAALRKQFGL